MNETTTTQRQGQGTADESGILAGGQEALPRLLLKPRDAAAALQISERTLWALTAPRGPIRCVRVGLRNRAVRYDPADLQAFIDQQKK